MTSPPLQWRLSHYRIAHAFENPVEGEVCLPLCIRPVTVIPDPMEDNTPRCSWCVMRERRRHGEQL